MAEKKAKKSGSISKRLLKARGGSTAKVVREHSEQMDVVRTRKRAAGSKSKIDPQPPRVQWVPKLGRARTKAPRQQKVFVQQVVNEVWYRLSLCVRQIIKIRLFERIDLVNVSAKIDDEMLLYRYVCSGVERLEQVEGNVTHGGSLITLNIAWFERTDVGRGKLIWVTAHEFAHVYTGTMQALAWKGFVEQVSDPSRMDILSRSLTLSRTDKIVAESLRWHERTERNPRRERDLEEEMADHTALAWGFGYERYCYDLALQRHILRVATTLWRRRHEAENPVKTVVFDRR